MINIKLELEENKVKITTHCEGNAPDVIKEATFMIDNTNDIYSTVIDHLPSFAKIIVLSDALKHMLEDNDND